MIRIALYIVCATSALVVGAKMIRMTAVQAQVNDGAASDEENCDENDLKKYPHRPHIPAKITEPSEEGEEKSPIIKELLKLVDEIDFEGDDDDDVDDQRDLLRKVLREADPELARSLGKNSLRLIQQANRRPPVIDVLKCCEPNRKKKAEAEEKKPAPDQKPEEKKPAGEDPFGE